MKKKYGGSETYIDFIRSASRHEHSIGYAQDFAGYLSKDEPGFIKFYFDFKSYIENLPQGKYDIIHPHFFVPAFFSQKNGFKTAFSSHCLISKEYELAKFDCKSEKELKEIKIANEFLKFYEELYYPQIDNTIVYCDFHKQEIEEMGGKCNRMNLAFNISEFEPKYDQKEARKKLKIPDKFTFLFLGRPTYLKGLTTLLDAFNEVSKEEKIQLVVVGDFFKEDDTLYYDPCVGAKSTKEVVFNNAENVIARSDQSRNIIPDYFLASDTLICPSFYEAGVSYVNLEAMASGIPIIASDIPGLSLILKNEQNCLLFKPGDSQELGKKMIELINNKELARNIVKNNKILIQEYNHIRCAEKLDKFYEDLI